MNPIILFTQENIKPKIQYHISGSDHKPDILIVACDVDIQYPDDSFGDKNTLIKRELAKYS